MATYQGHIIRKQSGYNYTRRNRLGILDARQDVQYMFPTEQVCVITEDDMFVFAMFGNAHTNTLYTDLTGQFLVESYNGMNYICVAHIYKLRPILTVRHNTLQNRICILYCVMYCPIFLTVTKSQNSKFSFLQRTQVLCNYSGATRRVLLTRTFLTDRDVIT